MITEAAIGREFRAKVFRSGNSVALRLPKALGLRHGDEMILREQDGGRYAFEPAPPAERFIDLTGIYGACPDIKPLTRAERGFEDRELDWDGKKLARG